jgi:ABC-2 type transport system permease protein
MNFTKVWLVARRELLYNIRRRSFLFTAFVIPVISIGISVFAGISSGAQLEDTGNFKRVGIVDQAGILTDVPRANVPPPYELLSLEQAQADLTSPSSTLPVYYVLPPDYLRTGQARSFSNVSLPAGLNDDLTKTVKKLLAAKTGSVAVVTRLENLTPKLVTRQPGSPQQYGETVLFAALFAPLIFALLQFTATLTTAQFLMSSVVEEKENRIMEVLATSTRPSELLWGKLLGLGTLGLVQLLVWGLVGLIFALTRGADNVAVTLASLQLTPRVVGIILVYFLLGYLLNGAILAGIGASVNAEAESRQVSGIFVLISVIPIFFLVAFITDANGPLPTFLSIFPFTSPMSMILRVTFTDVPIAHLLISIVVLALTTIIVMWIVARVFRLGMLTYGKRLGFRDIVRALREANPIAVQTMPKEA